ncbi:MAG TPA: hypothetical protein VGP89_09160 [Candidatus Angelobacter sp.]|nr:hypothetical protein [Candidatus Angelobacter sp.]
MTQRVGFAPLVILFISICGFAQSLPDISSAKELPATTPPSPRYQRVSPPSIHTQANVLHNSASTVLKEGTLGVPFNRANVITVPNFEGSFISRGKTWHFTMVGSAPWDGSSTSIPVHMIAVSLRLENANLVSYTTVSVAPFEASTLSSPNFQPSNYSTGAAIQFGDAVQRAEFFNKMKAGWHTNLRPVAIVHRLTITVPRFSKVNVNGFPTQVQTYFTSKSSDGRTAVFLLDQFFNQQIFDVVVNEINAGRFTTAALNIALFPNTFLFSLNNSGGVGDCCVLGFHTFFTDTGAPKESRWLFAFASWVSPGVFSGFQDVTALSHEISESLNDPFVDNLVPAWQYPSQSGTCQNNLETGDPVEVLANPMFPMRIASATYHPQTEALLQWFEQKSTSTAINNAFSYPNTKALTRGATAFGPLNCP